MIHRRTGWLILALVVLAGVLGQPARPVHTGTTAAATTVAADSLAPESINLASPELGSFSRTTNSFGEAAPEGQAYTYGPFKPARTPGEMAGSRGVSTIDTSTGQTIGWQYETYDATGNVRIIRPQLDSGPGPHYVYDANGNFVGTW